MALPLIRYTSLVATFLFIIALVYGDETCVGKNSPDGVCEAWDATHMNKARAPPQCGKTKSWCQANGNLYRHSGSAQAYKAKAPLKSQICSVDAYQKHKVARWPAYRRSFRNPPSLSIQINLYSCAEEKDCCCQRLDSNRNTMVDVWQARPDGTYSSLRNKIDEGDCRARAVPDTQGSVTFETLAPGSTGVLGGLGPSGWDFGPYVAPVIHLLVSANEHAPTLVNVPILFDRKTLEQRSFSWKDWRGHGWMDGSPSEETAYRTVSWTPNPKENRIDIQLDVFLAASDEEISLEKALCPAKLYGMPWSFYKEPIAECAPSLLDFFAL